MRTGFGWPQGCPFQSCRQLACNVSLVQDPQVMWWLCGWGRCTDEQNLDQCQIFPKHTHCLWNCYIFYVHSISECNGQNIRTLQLAMFCLKCNASTTVNYRFLWKPVICAQVKLLSYTFITLVHLSEKLQFCSFLCFWHTVMLSHDYSFPMFISLSMVPWEMLCRFMMFTEIITPLMMASCGWNMWQPYINNSCWNETNTAFGWY